VRLAEGIEHPPPFETEPGFERRGWIVDAGVNDAAVMGARVETGPGVPLEQADGLASGGELCGAREAHDPGADDDRVDF
jgi:hypothetical protein